MSLDEFRKIAQGTFSATHVVTINGHTFPATELDGKLIVDLRLLEDVPAALPLNILTYQPERLLAMGVPKEWVETAETSEPPGFILHKGGLW